jgi:hypothetical protein
MDGRNTCPHDRDGNGSFLKDLISDRLLQRRLDGVRCLRAGAILLWLWALVQTLLERL